jgi:hypothetical protein
MPVTVTVCMPFAMTTMITVVLAFVVAALGVGVMLVPMVMVMVVVVRLVALMLGACTVVVFRAHQ